MREIKFRAWDKSRNRMIVVPRINFGDDGSALTITVHDKTIEGFDNMYVVGESCELMQFTGVHDENEKEVYEGDICTQTFGRDPQEEKGVVTIEATRGVMVGDKPIWLHNVEVIGNIYENPDLLQ